MNSKEIKSKKVTWKKIFGWLLLISILVNGFQYLYTNQVTEKFKSKQDEGISLQKEICTTKIKKIEEKSLDQLTRVYSWSIRSALTRNNFDQVSEYFSQMIQFDDRCEEINLYDMEGIIKVSTNQDYLDDPIQVHYNISPQEMESHFSQISTDSSRITVHTPISIYNEIEYGLMIKYSLPKT